MSATFQMVSKTPLKKWVQNRQSPRISHALQSSVIFVFFHPNVFVVEMFENLPPCFCN